MSKQVKYLFFSVLFLGSVGLSAQDSLEMALEWPREVKINKGVLTYYEPQIDGYLDNILQGRCAISYQPTGKDMMFGAFWFRAFLNTDKEERTATLDQIDILKLVFPGIDSTKIDKASATIKRQIENMNITLSLDRLLASLSGDKAIKAKSDSINNSPPQIYYREEPTILISVDGQPLWKEMKDNQLEYVLNSPFFIAKSSKTGAYYINGGGNWYLKSSKDTDWEETKKVPKNIKEFAEANKPKDQPADTGKVADIVPKVLVVYKPSELIVTDGEPDYKTIEGTSLLYVSNTEDDIIMDINSQLYYVLIAGRWYNSKTLADGSWSFEQPGDLPSDFSKIPDSSSMADVLASVPETDAAENALLEQVIPQTATVNRKEAKFEVRFDGTPQFKQIPNTEVSYSENSDKSVLKIGQKYYGVDNGIWFVSDYPTGPWEVSDYRPEEVDQIPPSAPVYNTKYVYIYGSTPEVVYVGYLPGYVNSYVYQGVVVYGTGYYYPYWYGSVYYPRPVTFGYSVHYNPYTGWGFSASFSYGWIGWGYHSYYRSYWGPCGYHAGYRGGYYHGYRHGYAHGYNRGAVEGYRAGSRNAYRNQTTGVRNTATRNQMARNTRNISQPSSRPNNMYTDRQGNVYQRGESGKWNEMNNRPNTSNPNRTKDLNGGNTRENQRPQKQTRENQRPTQPQNNLSRERPQPNTQQNLNRDYQIRQQGQNNFNRSYQQRAPTQSRQPSMNRTLPRGGGGRRR